MMLYHFSEDPGIELFRPHVAKTAAVQNEAFVWAIDDWHAPMYYVPRDCPRACFWAGPKTTPEDRERWFSHLDPRFVMVVESSWLDRIRSARLYRYTWRWPLRQLGSRGADPGGSSRRSTLSDRGRSRRVADYAPPWTNVEGDLDIIDSGVLGYATTQRAGLPCGVW